MAEYTEEQKDTIRRGALGAMALVAGADRGFFDTFKESAAGAKAFAAAPENIRELLKGGFVAPPMGSAAEVEAGILGQLKEAIGFLDPADKDGFVQVITAAVNSVAEAAKGTSPEEQAVIDKVTAALAG